jgi:hypothetical protein
MAKTGLVLGLDVSTSITGLVLLDNVIDFDPKKNIVHYEPIEFKGCTTFWQKCDKIKSQLDKLYIQQPNVESFFIEEPMKRFAEGFSSAETISVLQRFNGIVCYLVREVWKIDPVYINVSSARKSIGIKVTTKAKAGGRNAKQQTFDHVTAGDLNHIVWPTKKRSVNTVDWAKDVVDAFVIARAGIILNNSGVVK